MLQDASFSRLERVLFWVLVLLYALPVWRWHYFLTIDGPTHLYNAWLLKTMLLAPASQLHQWLAFNLSPEPNYLSHLLLGSLLTVLPPWLAEKLVQTAYVVGLPLAMRYLLRSWQPAAGFLAVLAFPLIYSVVFVFGFYNFCLSLVLLLLVLGYWRRHVALAPRPAAAVWKLAGLVLLLYFSHPLTYLVSGLVLGLLLGEQVLRRQLPTWAAAGRAVGAVALAYLPTLPLLGWYFWQKGAATSQPAGSARTNLAEWLRLAPLRHMTPAAGTHSPLGLNAATLRLLAGTEAVYLRLYVLLLAGALLYAAGQLLRRRASGWMWAWWVAAGLMVLAFVFLPDAISGGSVIRPRWGIFSYLLLLASLAAVPFGPRVRAALLLAGTAGALLLLGLRYTRYGNLQAGLADYLAVSAQLQAHSSVLPLIYANPERMPNGREYPSAYNMLSHAASYVSIERQLLDFENYEAETNYFPLLWRPGRLPLRQPNGTPARPTSVLLAHPAQYVVLWGRQQPSADGSAANRALIGQYLAQHYRFAYRSPGGLLELYSQNVPAEQPLVTQ